MATSPHHLYIDSAATGQVTHIVIYRPEGAVRAVLQIVHGMIEHIGRYDAFAQWLAARGIAVIGHDHPGHGLSAFDPERGTLRPGAQFGHYADPLTLQEPQDGRYAGQTLNGTDIVLGNMWRVTQTAQREWPGVPLYIMGHSMGSFFTRRFITLHSEALAGAIIMGTGWHTAIETVPGLWLSRLIATCCGRRRTSRLLTLLTNGGYDKAFPGEGHNAWLSVNPDNVKAHNEDPLCQFEFSAGAYADFFRCMNALAHRRDYDRIRHDLPILVTSGGDDPVGGRKAVQKVADEYQRLGIRDITRKVYDGLRHEIIGEACREQVFADIEGWIIQVSQASLVSDKVKSRLRR